MSEQTLTDSELLSAITLDDKKAFDLLFSRHWRSVYATAYYYLRDSAVSSDIVHDLFLNIWEKRSVLKIITFKSYILAATRYRVYNQLKNKSTLKLSYVADYESIDIIGAHNNEGAVHLLEEELDHTLDLALKDLPSRCREIFILSRKEQMSNDEISKLLGISKRSVENQITSALKFLRIYLKDIAVSLILISLT